MQDAAAAGAKGAAHCALCQSGQHKLDVLGHSTTRNTDLTGSRGHVQGSQCTRAWPIVTVMSCHVLL